MRMPTESQAMLRLAACAREILAGAFVRGAAQALLYRLGIDARETACWTTLPLGIFREPLPPDVRSAWVFALRRGHVFPAERHPDSIQRMFALSGHGAMEVWDDGAWHASSLSGLMAHEGLSIRPGMWHRPAVLESDWTVLSFHTASAEDLVEETGDPASDLAAARTRYLDKFAIDAGTRAGG